MNLRNLFTTICVSLLIVGLFSGCKGLQGEVGPQGETGLQGGNNVYVTNWNSYTQWTASGDKVRRLIQYSNNFDIDKDAILVFVRYTSTGQAEQMPVQVNIGRGYLFSFVTRDNTITTINRPPGETLLDLVATSQQVIADSHVQTELSKFQVRTVFIKSGRKAAIDYSDYEVVKKAYNITD